MHTIADATARLLAARRSGQPQPAPTLADAHAAYAVQAAVAEALGWFDGAPQHWKSGGASRDAVLTHAPLPPAGVHASPADLRGSPLHFRVIEAEIALRIAEPIDAARAALDRPPAIDAMCVAIEVVDSRWADGLQAPALAKLADLQSHAALVLGAWQPFVPRDWAAQRGRVSIGGVVHAFQGSHALGDPAWGVSAWLRHATRDGAVVPAGTVVTTGTWCGMPLAAPGDAVRVEFDGIGEAALQF